MRLWITEWKCTVEMRRYKWIKQLKSVACIRFGWFQHKEHPWSCLRVRLRTCVLLQNLSSSEARGEILQYQVTLQEVTRKITLQNITTHTSWTGVIPRTGAWTASVSAASSKGSSAPTRINIVDLCGTGRYLVSLTMPVGSSLPHLFSPAGAGQSVVWAAKSLDFGVNSCPFLLPWQCPWANEL